MNSNEIGLLITDFDGTLVDTEKANYGACKKALEERDFQLNPDMYRLCFGLKFSELMARIGISNEYDICKI